MNLELNQILIECVNAAKRGDSSAFARIYDLSSDQVFKFCFYLCGNREQAQDITHDTFLRSFRAIDTLQPDSRVLPWMFKIARNLFLDRCRSKAEAPKLELDQTDGVLLDEMTESDRSGVVDLRAALAQLDHDDRSLILYYEIGGLSAEEIAEMYGIKKNLVYQRLHRVRKALKKILGGP